jgi:glycosyltransferase involved in cell wall biosynthesis
MRTRAEQMNLPASVPFRLESRLLASYEARLAAAADSASLVSQADTRAPGLENVSVIPNGVDLDEFPFEEPRERPPELVFFGNLGYFHNVSAAELTAREVLPLVREAVPGASLRLVGARPAPAVTSLASLPGVTVTGEVPAMAPELHRAAVAVLPLQSGSGIKNKVLEAFASGTPVVSNALGVQGVEGAEPGTHYLVGETPAELAAAAVRLIEDGKLRLALARRGLELVQRSYSWRAQGLRLLELYGCAR